jgi:hypothetical protein
MVLFDAGVRSVALVAMDRVNRPRSDRPPSAAWIGVRLTRTARPRVGAGAAACPLHARSIAHAVAVFGCAAGIEVGRPARRARRDAAGHRRLRARGTHRRRSGKQRQLVASVISILEIGAIAFYISAARARFELVTHAVGAARLVTRTALGGGRRARASLALGARTGGRGGSIGVDRGAAGVLRGVGSVVTRRRVGDRGAAVLRRRAARSTRRSAAAYCARTRAARSRRGAARTHCGFAAGARRSAGAEGSASTRDTR